jgi:hypothetical protein
LGRVFVVQTGMCIAGQWSGHRLSITRNRVS